MATPTSYRTFLTARTWRVLSWAGIALQVVALVVALALLRWDGATAIAVFLVLCLVFMLAQNRIPGFLDFLVVLAAMGNAAGWAWGFFEAFVWYDEAVHFFTTFAAVAALGYLLLNTGFIRPTFGGGGLVAAFALLGFGLGILWEVAEALFLNLRLWDTISDLVLDTIGGILAAWLYSRTGRLRA